MISRTTSRRRSPKLMKTTPSRMRRRRTATSRVPTPTTRATRLHQGRGRPRRQLQMSRPRSSALPSSSRRAAGRRRQFTGRRGHGPGSARRRRRRRAAASTKGAALGAAGRDPRHDPDARAAATGRRRRGSCQVAPAEARGLRPELARRARGPAAEHGRHRPARALPENAPPADFPAATLKMSAYRPARAENAPRRDC